MLKRWWSRATATDPEPAPDAAARETLADRLAEGALPEAEAVRFSIGLAESLREIHRQGRVYGLLHPAGVAIVEKHVRLLPAVPAEVTPYSSPEQLAGADLDWRSDIFSLGAVMYEMWSGRRVFRAATKAALRMEIPNRDVAAPEIASPALAGMIRRCLEKKPERRIQRLEILLAELKLHNALGGAPAALRRAAAPPLFEAARRAAAGAPGPARRKLKLACPICGADDVHVSPARGPLEAALAIVGIPIARCFRCYHRFLNVVGFAFEKQAGPDRNGRISTL